MALDVRKYSVLLQEIGEILQDYIDEENLNKLKSNYIDVINSRRTLESIVNIKGLLEILQKRGVLQYDDISVLHYIAENFVQDQAVDNLIINYEQWLSDHATQINNLYGFGKSSNLINNSDYIIHNEKNIDKIFDFDLVNVSNPESEDQFHKTLLSSSLVNIPITLQKYKDQKHKLNFTFRKRCSNISKRCTNNFIIIIASILTVCVIGVIVKIYNLSAVVVPEVEEYSNESVNELKSKIPLFPPNMNSLELSTNSTQTISRSKTESEKQLQTFVVNKISKKIGKYWAEVCRRLDVNEADIDEIENRLIEEKQGKHEKMFIEAIKIYFSEEHPNWKKDLMQALESSKRRDLKEEVEKIVY